MSDAEAAALTLGFGRRLGALAQAECLTDERLERELAGFYRALARSFVDRFVTATTGWAPVLRAGEFGSYAIEFLQIVEQYTELSSAVHRDAVRRVVDAAHEALTSRYRELTRTAAVVLQ